MIPGAPCPTQPSQHPFTSSRSSSNHSKARSLSSGPVSHHFRSQQVQPIHGDPLVAPPLNMSFDDQGRSNMPLAHLDFRDPAQADAFEKRLDPHSPTWQRDGQTFTLSTYVTHVLRVTDEARKLETGIEIRWDPQGSAALVASCRQHAHQWVEMTRHLSERQVQTFRRWDLPDSGTILSPEDADHWITHGLMGEPFVLGYTHGDNEQLCIQFLAQQMGRLKQQGFTTIYTEGELSFTTEPPPPILHRKPGGVGSIRRKTSWTAVELVAQEHGIEVIGIDTPTARPPYMTNAGSGPLFDPARGAGFNHHATTLIANDPRRQGKYLIACGIGHARFGSDLRASFEERVGIALTLDLPTVRLATSQHPTTAVVSHSRLLKIAPPYVEMSDIPAAILAYCAAPDPDTLASSSEEEPRGRSQERQDASQKAPRSHSYDGLDGKSEPTVRAFSADAVLIIPKE